MTKSPHKLENKEMNDSGGLCLHEAELLCSQIASLWMCLYLWHFYSRVVVGAIQQILFSVFPRRPPCLEFYMLPFSALFCIPSPSFFLFHLPSLPWKVLLFCASEAWSLWIFPFCCRGRGQVDMLRLQVQCTSGCKLKRIETRDSNGHLWASVGSRIITVVKRWKQPRCPITRWVDKQNVVYPCNEILFNLKKQENSDIYYHMDEPWRYYAKWSKAGTQG